MLGIILGLVIWLVVSAAIMIYVGYLDEPDTSLTSTSYIDTALVSLSWPIMLLGFVVFGPILVLFQGLGLFANQLALLGAWFRHKIKKV